MRKILILAVMMVMAMTVQAQAALQTIGTATYNTSDYNLIYDDDLEITWLDYTNYYDTWDSQMSWASGLNTGGVLTYNLNAGVSMNWSDEWRLPTALNQDGSGPCNGYNCTNSEMGHLFYTELGNTGAFDTFGNSTGCDGWIGEPTCLTNTGDFQNLQTNVYWSGTEYSASPDGAWAFNTGNGYQNGYGKGYDGYALAVRPGLAVVPEPMSMVLFVTGGAVLGFRRIRKAKV